MAKKKITQGQLTTSIAAAGGGGSTKNNTTKKNTTTLKSTLTSVASGKPATVTTTQTDAQRAAMFNAANQAAEQAQTATTAPVNTYPTQYTPTYQAVAPTPVEPYQKSKAVIDAEALYDRFLNGEGKPTYTSKYADTISALADKIANREQFKYNFNEDPLYQNYKDQYQRQALLGQQGAMAQAAALTGGYGNSYAATAGNLAYQENMSQLNNVIPQLYDAAMRKYENDIAGQRADLSMYEELEDSDYGRYRDTLGDWNTDRDFYGNDYYRKSDQDYAQYRDKVGDTQWKDSFNQSENQFGTNYNEDQHWKNKNFDYQKTLDDYQKYIDEKTFKYQQERDEIADRQAELNYQLNKQQEDFDERYKLASLGLKGSASGSSGRSGGGYRSSGGSSSGITANQRGVYSSIYKWKNGNSGQSKVAWNSLNGVLKDKYNLTPEQIDYLYYDYLGFKGGNKTQAVEATSSDNARRTSATKKEYQSIDDVIKDFGAKAVEDAHILSYVDFIRNMPSDRSLSKYKSYPDYLKKMVKKLTK